MRITFDHEDLQPLIEAIVVEAVAKLEADKTKLGDRLAFSEAEAARLIGLQSHQLRDERLRGRIPASRIVGGQIRYTRDDILEYLMSRRFEPP